MINATGALEISVSIGFIQSIHENVTINLIISFTKENRLARRKPGYVPDFILKPRKLLARIHVFNFCKRQRREILCVPDAEVVCQRFAGPA